MLKVTDSRDCGKTEIECGDYLPFKFWQKTLTTDPNAYWRTGDMKSTLLEMEIDRVSGQIIGVSLILPGKVRRDFPELDSANLPKTDGYPIVDLSE